MIKTIPLIIRGKSTNFNNKGKGGKDCMQVQKVATSYKDVLRGPRDMEGLIGMMMRKVANIVILFKIRNLKQK